MEASHDAFNIHVCYDNIKKFKITAIENWGSHRVVVGGSDGSIRVVEGDEDLTTVFFSFFFFSLIALCRLLSTKCFQKSKNKFL